VEYASAWRPRAARDMQPERNAGDAATLLRAQQDALAAYIRDPAHVAPPEGIDERRLKVYRDLFFNNVESMLAGNFPVLHRIFAGARWQALVRDFYRDHGSRTPLFTELAHEFLRYLETRQVADDPPWLQELAHYEWVELALQISEATREDIAHDADDDLIAGKPVVSPLAWPLAYAWPVHRIGPEFQPHVPPDAPTLLLLRREVDGKVSFHELSPLTFRLLQRLDAEPQYTGHEHLALLAAEADATDVEAFVRDGAAMLLQLHREGTVLGTRIDQVIAIP
jgi:hypothetical protein